MPDPEKPGKLTAPKCIRESEVLPESRWLIQGGGDLRVFSSSQTSVYAASIHGYGDSASRHVHCACPGRDGQAELTGVAGTYGDGLMVYPLADG